MRSYRTLEGATHDLDTLTPEETTCLSELLLAYAQNCRYWDFFMLVVRPGGQVLKGKPMVTAEAAGTTLFKIAEDLRYRLGIRQGEVGPDPGDDPNTEPLSPDEWVPLEEAARLKKVTSMGIRKAIERGNLLSRSNPGERGVWISRTSLDAYQPLAGRQKAGRAPRKHTGDSE